MLLGLGSPAKYDMLGLFIAMKDSLRFVLSTITERNIRMKPSIAQAKLSIIEEVLGSEHCLPETIVSSGLHLWS